MSDFPAESGPTPTEPVKRPPPEQAAARRAAIPAPPRGGWTVSRWWLLIILVFALHLALIYLFGAQKQILPRAVTGLLTMQFATNADDLLSLESPTLFVWPRPDRSATATLPEAAFLNIPSVRWTEPPRWLPVSPDELMSLFSRFIRTNRVAEPAISLKPPPESTAPKPAITPAFPSGSAMRLEGDLAQRRLLKPANLPSWPFQDVIAPSKVLVLVDGEGHVVSAVLLPSDNSLEAVRHDDAADQFALEFARAARFTPAPQLTIGRIIFMWHAEPPPASMPASAPLK